MNHAWITKKQAAEELQVNERTIARWIKAGLLQSAQMVPNGTVRISAASIEKMLERKTRNTPAIGSSD
jgi:excisionase family DNA binding protein